MLALSYVDNSTLQSCVDVCRVCGIERGRDHEMIMSWNALHRGNHSRGQFSDF